jgi:hypothetical protein
VDYIPQRVNIARPIGEFFISPQNVLLLPMNPVEETRRIRLKMLVKKHESMANLCQLLGYARNETATLTRIMNANVRHEREGKVYNMGSPMARQIEEILGYETGWMDTPPTYAELDGGHSYTNQVMLCMESMSTEDQATVFRLVNAVAKPKEKNGTTGV